MATWIAVVSWSEYDSGGAVVYQAEADDAAQATNIIAQLILKDEQSGADVVGFYRIAEKASEDEVEAAVRAAKSVRDAEASAKNAERQRVADLAQLAALRAKYPDA